MGSEYFVLPILILLLYTAIRVLQSKKTITIRSIGVILIIIGLFGIILSTPVLSSSQVKIENIEKYQGIEDVKEYNESEYVPIGNNEVLEIVVDQETERIELLNPKGENVETIQRGSNQIESQNLKKYDVVMVKVIDDEGRTIDKGNITVKTSYDNTELR